MSFAPNLKALAKAVLVGTLAGAALPTVLMAILALMQMTDGDSISNARGSALLMLLFPALLVFCVVLPATILVGLPVTALLRRLEWESELAYRIIGALVGLAIPTLLLWSEGFEFSVILAGQGAISGAATGWAWGRERIGMRG